MKTEFVVDKNILTICHKQIIFQYFIADTLNIGNLFIVRIDPPPGVIFNKNIYGVSASGEILWQIEVVNHDGYDDNPYVNMVQNGPASIAVYDWIGFEYSLNLENGTVSLVDFKRF